MNIGIVTTWFERGAAYVSRQYADILRQRHNVYIYARGGESFGFQSDSTENVTRGKETYIQVATAINLRDFKRWIRENSLEVVFFNEQHWWEPVLLCRKLAITCGAYIDYYTEATVPIFGCYDFLICNTKRHFSAFNWHPQCYYIPWGTDTELFTCKHPKPVNKGIVTFIHSAGMSPERKGTDLVLKAFAQLRKPARLVIHAQSDIREWQPDLKELIDTLEQNGCLQLLYGPMQPHELYQMGDVYVYPSRLDGIGLTIAEALACGLPVITSDYPPMNEFVSGGSGTLVKIDRVFARRDGYYWPQCLVDESDLTRAMAKYISQYTSLSKLKRTARKYAEHSLDWKKNTAGLSSLFEQAHRLPSEKSLHAQNLANEFEKNRFPFIRRFPRTLKFIWLVYFYYEKLFHIH